MSLKQISAKWRELPPLRFIAEAISYRLPRTVVEIVIYNSGDGYPVCPRCKTPIEREYMRFCDRCGQKLDWSRLDSAHVRTWRK